MTTTGSRYPLMFNPTRLNKGQAKAKTQQKTPGLTNKSKDLKYYDGQSHGETTKKLETRVVKKSTGGSTNKATGNRSQPAPKSSQVGYNSQNVNFRGGRPFGPNNRPAVEVKKENKTQDSQGYKSNTGGTVRQNNKKVLLKQSNDRVKLVKEIIKEEAVPLLSSVQESPRVGEVNVNQHGSVGYKATVVPDERGPLTINLYLQPDNQTSETTIDTGTQSDKRLIGRDKVEGPQRETDSTNKAHTLIPNVSKSNPTHGGSMDPAKKPNISEGNYTSVEDGSPHVKQAPLEQKPVDTRAVFDSPHTQSPGHFAHPKINSQRPTISIDDANKHLLQLENADPHRKNSQLQMPHASETLNVRRNHLTSSSPARKLSKGKQVHYYNNGVQDLKPGVSDDSSNEEYDYFSDTDFKSRPEIVFTPIDELLNPVTGNGLGDQRPQSENMDNRQHDLKSYPRPVDSRERFEQRLDHEILKDMRHQQAALYPVRDQYAHGMGRKTPDHLKDLSVKHYLESRSRLTSGEASPLHSPTRSPQHHVHSRGHHRESVGVRNAHTNTGTIQYVLRNKNNKQDSSTSSVSTIAMDSQTPTLPHIYGHMPPIPQPRKKTTRRVKDSEAQTDYNSDLSDAESDTVSTQEIAIQTQKVPKQDQPVTMTQESTKEATQSGIEIGIQTNDVPKDAFTQTYEEPKTVSTSTDDLLPSVPTTPKGGTIESAAKSPVLPLYRSETMYKHIRDIIQAEDDPETSPTKTDSGYLDGGDGDDDIIAGLMTEMENEVYVLYMRTDDGAVVGPLMLEVDDVQIGLPKPVEKSVVFSDEIDTSRYSPAPGLRNRATGSNSVNEHSSRSHSMLTVNVDSEMQDPDDDSVYITKHGKLTFVDLAGSEKTKTDMVTSQEHLVESNNINRSLLVLGNCISSLGDPKKRNGHIPYRDSKLTKLLADSLGGNGVTLMIACVSPSGVNSGETMNTLRYANRAKKIKSKPVVKMDPRERLIVSLKREIKILRQENHYLRQQLDFPVKPRGQLQKENDQKFLQMLKGGKKDGKISDSGLYEMLQEYMIENELIRSENSDLHQMRDTGRREQQTLSRENERLLRKLEQLEKERMLMNTPMSVYSVGSTISRRSSGVESEAGNPPPPNYMGKDTPRANKKTHLQHPARPPHRLSEPVNKNNPGTIESQRPNNGYAARYTNQQDQLRSNPPPRGVGTGPAPQDPVPHHGASYPEVVPSPNNPVNTRTGGTGVSKAKPKPAFSQEAPVAQPRKSKGAFQPPNSQGIPTSHSNLTATEEEDDLDTESIAAMNDRLRQELLDLEGQIKKQTRLATRTDAQPSSSIPDGYSRR